MHTFTIFNLRMMKTVLYPSGSTRFRVVLLGELAATLLRALGRTWKFTKHEGVDSDFFHDQTPCIYAFWHGQQLILPAAYTVFKSRRSSKGIYTLSSAHADGRIIAHALKYFGIQSIVGSSSRRGGQALLELIRKSEEGYDLSFTPDGPTGPPFKAKIGIIEAARLSGAPIIPIACGADRSWKVNSWDSMIIPKPWAKLFFMMGPPIRIPLETTKEELPKYAEQLSNELNRLTKEVYESY